MQKAIPTAYGMTSLCLCCLCAAASAQQPGQTGIGNNTKPTFTMFDAPGAGTYPGHGTFPLGINAAGVSLAGSRRPRRFRVS